MLQLFNIQLPRVLAIRLFRVITVSVNSAAFCGEMAAGDINRRKLQQHGNCQCQLLAVVGCLSTMKIVVDGSFCRNQHFLVGITCRNRVIPGLGSAGQCQTRSTGSVGK